MSLHDVAFLEVTSRYVNYRLYKIFCEIDWLLDSVIE